MNAVNGPQEADAILSHKADQPIDIFNEGPLRIVLAVAGPDDFYLLMIGHHVFLDMTGMRIIMQDYLDLCLAPQAADAGLLPAPDPKQSFFSYAQQEDNMLRNGTYEKRVEYWLRQLSTADPDLHITTKQGNRPEHAPKSIPFSLDEEAYERFSARAHRLQVTPFALVSSALFHALRQYTGQSELLLGVASDARRRPFERTAGMFSGMFLLRQSEQAIGMSDAAVRANFKNVMQAVRNYLNYFCFMDQIPWLKQRSALGPATSDVFIDFWPKNAPSQSSVGRRSDVTVTAFPLLSRSIPFEQPLTNWTFGLIGDTQEYGLSGMIEYDSSVIPESAAREILDSWKAALTQNPAL